MSRGQDIEDHLISYAERIVKLSNNMPESKAGNHINGQLLRSGTAPAAHYAEARNAESNRDFNHKMRLGLKELNESRIWLRIIMEVDLIKTNLVSDLHQEYEALCRIFGASISTAKARQAKQ
jgi:four helix bundle protein